MELSVHLARRGPTSGEARDFLGLAVLALPLALVVLARFKAMSLLVAHLAAIPAGSHLALLTLVRVARVVVAVTVGLAVTLALVPSCSLSIPTAHGKPTE